MKLYLSSYYFGNKTHELTRMVDAKKRVAIIMNAADIYRNEKRPVYLNTEINKFKQLGLTAEELDLREYFNNNEGLTHRLKEYGIVWVMGGNAFVLNRALRQSGADKILPSMIISNELVYAGFSAGSVVAGKDLHGIELVDNPWTVPEAYNPNVVWDGLNLVDFSIAPHYKSDHPESEMIDGVVEYFKEHSMAYKTISDGEVIIVDTPAA